MLIFPLSNVILELIMQGIQKVTNTSVILIIWQIMWIPELDKDLLEISQIHPGASFWLFRQEHVLDEDMMEFSLCWELFIWVSFWLVW